MGTGFDFMVTITPPTILLQLLLCPWMWGSFFWWVPVIEESFPGGSNGKVSSYNVGDPDSIPGSGRFPGEGNGNPLQYSCLENLMDGGTW